MPDTDPLSDLRRQLAIAMGPTTAMRSTPWVDPLPMRKVLRDIERQFDSIEAAPREDTLRSTVRSFLASGRAADYKELKYTCYGVSIALDEEQSRLTDEPQAFARLLAQVDGERGEDRRFVRCYQALLQSYFAFTSASGQTTTQLQAQPSFQELRGFLSDRLEVVARPIRGRIAGWAITLQEHRNLLTESPCQRYTDDLAQGKTDQLAEVCNGLGINRESWVWQEIILAYLREVCLRDDRGFKQSLGQALDLSGGQTTLVPSPSTSRTVVAQVVKRYSEATEKPELPRLRDAAIQHIGNPWLRRPAWDAWVRHEPARQMVDGWLKSKLMEDFFTLLSEKSGGGVDTRRLKYWLKFVDVIEDMWFMLGPDAFHDRSAGFVEMRTRMKGRLKAMTGGPSQNNAFVMRIGGHQFIEFGSKGNALYIYSPEAQVFTDHQTTITLTALKRGNDRLSHISDWEWTFDQRLRRIFGQDILSPRSGQIEAPDAKIPSPAAPVAEATTSSAPVAPAQTPTLSPASRKAPDLWELLSQCHQSGIDSRIVDTLKPVVWLSKNAIQVQHIAAHLARLNFRFVEGPSNEGFWHFGGKVQKSTPSPEVLAPESTPAIQKKIPGPDMASFLAACREAGIECRMMHNGEVWLSKGAIKVPHIAAELATRGFRYVGDPSREGFWSGHRKATQPSVPHEAAPETTPPNIKSDDKQEPQAVVDLSRLPMRVQVVLDTCKTREIKFKVFNEEHCTVWIEKSVIQNSDIWQELKVLEFSYKSESSRLGFWFSTAGTIPSHLHRLYDTPRAKQLRHAENKDDVRNQLHSIFDQCLRVKLAYKDLSTHKPQVWIHKDAGLWPTLERAILSIGFRLKGQGESSGYWLGDPMPAQAAARKTPAKPHEIASTLATCDKLDIVWVDLRERGGNLWVYTDSATFPTIAERLELQGFCFSEKKRAYWLPEES